MMTIPFKLNGQSPFTFQATVGGIKVFGKVPYNLYANRYYVNLTDGQGRRICYVPMVASPDDYDINLALPCSPGTLVFRASSQQFEAT